MSGYSALLTYYKPLLEKLDVSTHVLRDRHLCFGDRTHLHETTCPMLREESATRWITQLWSAFVDDVATNRNIDAKVLNPTMDELLAEMRSVNGDIAKLSLKLGLVDELATRQDIRTLFAKEFGSDGKDSYNAISYYDYQATMHPDYSSSEDDIAVVVASGAIMDGQQPRGTVGGDTVASLLRQARNDKNVKAVVLRVNSPVWQRLCVGSDS
ncbi:S49 family peptidase [Vibrio sp. M60_M31a]